MPGTDQTRTVMLIQLISMFLLPFTGIWMMFDLLGLHFSPYSPNITVHLQSFSQRFAEIRTRNLGDRDACTEFIYF